MIKTFTPYDLQLSPLEGLDLTITITKKIFSLNLIYIYLTNIQIISKNLQATCIVTVSSSAPRRPGTSARHWRGRPWSLQFQVNIYKVFLKKEIYNL